MAKKRPGRPPSGPGGERISDWKPLTIRLPPLRRAELDAVAFLQEKPVSAVVDDALAAYLKGLPASEKRLVGEIVRKKGR